MISLLYYTHIKREITTMALMMSAMTTAMVCLHCNLIGMIIFTEELAKIKRISLVHIIFEIIPLNKSRPCAL